MITNRYIHRNLLKYLSIFYALAVCFKFLRHAYLKYNNGDQYLTSFNWAELVIYELFLDWFLVMGFMSFVGFISLKMIKLKMNWALILFVHISFAFLLSLYSFFFRTFISSLSNSSIKIEELYYTISAERLIGGAEKYYLLYFSMIGIVYVYYYVNETKNAEIQKSILNKNLVGAKMKALKSQMHPHFMFNTLNSISSLIEIDQEKSQNMIADFGDLFRELIAIRDEELIPLKQELTFVNKYIDIISVRFSDHLVIKQDITVDQDEVFIPSMLIQPILENSIKHGYSIDHTELDVLLKMFIEGDYLVILIENNGKSINDNYEDLIEEGTGIKNTIDRLSTLYQDDYLFEMTNIKNLLGVFTKIELPLNKNQ